MQNQHIFKVGEIVFYPAHGFARLVDSNNTQLPFLISGTPFRKDGRRFADDKYPALLTLEQAKLLGYELPMRKKKKEITRWVNVYEGVLLGGVIFMTEDEAKIAAGTIQDVTQQITFTVEVEEEVAVTDI